MDVELQQKKFFLKWSMHHFLFPQREVYWILNYLINHPLILRESHFVEQVEQTPRGLKIDVDGGQPSEPILQLYLNGHQFTSTDQIFHEIRLNQKKPLYIEFAFHQSWQTPEYLGVLEDNPYCRWNDQVSDETYQQVDDYLDHLRKEHRLDELHQEIDMALEQKDWGKLSFLAEELKEYQMVKGSNYEGTTGTA